MHREIYERRNMVIITNVLWIQKYWNQYKSDYLDRLIDKDVWENTGIYTTEGLITLIYFSNYLETSLIECILYL